MDAAFLQKRIDATKSEIVAYEDAIAALSTGILSYTIDTGQSRQTVTRSETMSVQRTIDSLYNRLATLEARLNGSGVHTGRPVW